MLREREDITVDESPPFADAGAAASGDQSVCFEVDMPLCRLSLSCEVFVLLIASLPAGFPDKFLLPLSELESASLAFRSSAAFLDDVLPASD